MPDSWKDEISTWEQSQPKQCHGATITYSKHDGIKQKYYTDIKYRVTLPILLVECP